MSSSRLTSRSLHRTPAAAVALLAASLSTGCIIRTQADVDAAAEAKVQAAEAAAEPEPEFPGESGPAVPVRVDVTPEVRHQALEGFGASVAWYLDRLTGETEPGAYEMLFTELGLDILRFRNRFERTDGSDGNLNEEGEIFRRATEALGHPPKVLMSSWSPPAALKANNVEKCAGEATCTLKKENGQFVYDKMADWWRRSLIAYAEVGVVPDFVSFQNEPDFVPPFWEGCKYEAQETEEYPGYDRQLVHFHQAMQTLPKPPKILGPEVLGIHYGKIQRYMAALNQDLLYGMAHHIYERGNDDMWDWREPGPDSFNDELAAAAQLTDKPIFQTEFNTDEDRGKDGGFETAWLIHNSLVVEGAASFLYWELYWPGLKGLAGVSGKRFRKRDHYYSMRHYSLYTDPGYVRVETQSNQEEMLASAYVAPDGSRMTVVLLNTSPEAADVEITSGNFPHRSKKAFRTIFRPGESKQWRELDTSAGKLRMPERSVITLVFER